MAGLVNSAPLIRAFEQESRNFGFELFAPELFLLLMYFSRTTARESPHGLVSITRRSRPSTLASSIAKIRPLAHADPIGIKPGSTSWPRR